MRSHSLIVASALGLGALSLLGGCSVPLSEGVVELTNRCTETADCGGTGQCIENTCVATEADLSDLIIEIEVPSDAPFAPATTHVIAPGEDPSISLTGSSVFFQNYTLYLNELVSLTVSLNVDNIPAACGGLSGEGGVPIRVELSQTRTTTMEIPPGVATRVYSATTPEGSPNNAVVLNVPLGAYDIYITPIVGDPEDPENPFADCELPPRLLSDRDISSGVIEETVDAASPGQVGTVQGINLDGWTVSLIENKKGRLISSVDELDLSEIDTPAPFTLKTWEEEDQDNVVLRLTPPPDQAATEGMPVFYWVLSQLPNNSVTVESLQGVDPIPVTGTVLDQNSADSVPSRITIHSTSIDIGFGPNVIYRRSINTDPDGGFGGVKLLPGSYRFIIQPVEGGDLAVTDEPVELQPGDLGGKTLNVRAKLPLNGLATTASGDAAARINAVLAPTLPSTGTFLQNVQQTLPVPPSSAATITNSTGLFSLLVDRGEFNLSLRPDASSDFPWAVVSRYYVDPAIESLDDISLQIPHPVLLYGEVRSLGSTSHTLGNARIRAWIRPTPLDNETGPTELAAIQIAETTSEENGSFRLLLPGSLSTIAQEAAPPEEQ